MKLRSYSYNRLDRKIERILKITAKTFQSSLSLLKNECM